MTTQRRLPFHYAWFVAALTFFALLVVAGIRSASGVLLIPLEQTMGWTAVSISIAIAINVALYGLLAPLAAAFMESVGIRATILAALVIVSIAAIASAFIMTPFQLAMTWGVGVGLGSGMISMVLGAVIATRWFVTRRGLVYGVLTGSTAAGQLVFLPLLAWVAQVYTWRAVGLTCAAAALIAAIPVALFMRDHPHMMGLLPFGATEAEAAQPPARAHGTNPFRNTFAVLGRASRYRDFWLVGGTFFICGATTNGYIGTHFLAMCGDVGISQVHAAGYVALLGLFSLLGSAGSGFLSDRYPAGILLFIYYLMRALSLFLLPYALVGDANAFLLPAFMIFYGLDWLATGAPNVRALTEALGAKDTPIAFGWIAVFHQLGAGGSALLAGVLRTNFGSYQITYNLFGIACIVAALGALAIGAKGGLRPQRPPLVTSGAQA